tara:strand:+ start:686 stop:871 length:186 start_codon:yes stop_codon:yes gene_type:complete
MLVQSHVPVVVAAVLIFLVLVELVDLVVVDPVVVMLQTEQQIQAAAAVVVETNLPVVAGLV